MKRDADPMVCLTDLREAFNALCPECERTVRGALLKALATKRSADPRPLAMLRREVADGFGIREEDLTGPRQSRHCVSARRTFSRMASERGFSLNEIGRALRKHHTTVFHLLGRRGQ
jgi:chromosomal replication initiation ATPase DnaA